MGSEMCIRDSHQLLGTCATSRQCIDPNIIGNGPILSQEQQVELCRPLSDSEIKQGVSSIPNHKSRGPDGFSSGFYKATWDQAGSLIRGAIRYFFATSTLPRAFGETKLTVLPKVQCPSSATDFRPISCCNVIYKANSKILCSRLKVVLPHLIDQSQAAFVPGREIIYNILICQDLARGYQRQHISLRCLLKMDLHKAFGSIYWELLQELLQALHFPQLFIRWIMACVTNATFHIQLNGRLHEAVEGKRGLRQEDPLSHYCLCSRWTIYPDSSTMLPVTRNSSTTRRVGSCTCPT